MSYIIDILPFPYPLSKSYSLYVGLGILCLLDFLTSFQYEYEVSKFQIIPLVSSVVTEVMTVPAWIGPAVVKGHSSYS